MSNNYYDKIMDSTAYSIEQVKFSSIKNVEGKFFIKLLTPTASSSKAETKSKAGIKSANYITLTIPAYMLYQFIETEIKTVQDTTGKNCKALVLKSTQSVPFKIPKGTIFFVEFLGGEAEADKTYIVGVSPYKFVQ